MFEEKGKKKAALVQFFSNKINEHTTRLMMWNNLWREVRTFVNPLREDLMDKKVIGSPDRTKRIYDNTAVIASRKLASGIYSYNISPTQKEWFAFQASFYDLMNIDEVQRWYSVLNQMSMLYLMASNFLLEAHLWIHDICTYGTGCIYVDWNKKEQKLHFKSHPIGSYSFDCNEDGSPNTVYVKYEKSAQELAEKFGKENLSVKAREALIKTQRDGSVQKFKVWHIVGKKDNIGYPTEFGKNATKMPYYSYYFEEASKHLVALKGYKSMPYIVSRFYKHNQEDFGHCPATMSMCDIKDANAVKHLLKYSTATKVKPPLFVPEGGILDVKRLNLGADGRNKYNPTMGGDKPFYLMPQGDLAIGWNELQDIRNSIRESFFWEMFDALGERRNMTALEVSQRVQQQLELFSPTQGRLQTEGFDPLLTRVAQLVVTAKGIPPPPQVLIENPDYKIVYRSKLALSIKNIQTTGFVRSMNIITPLLQTNPELMDNIDLDKVTRDIMLAESVPAEWLKDIKEVAMIRQAKVKQAEAQAKQESMQGMAQMAGQLSKPVDSSSVLANLEEGM